MVRGIFLLMIVIGLFSGTRLFAKESVHSGFKTKLIYFTAGFANSGEIGEIIKSRAWIDGTPDNKAPESIECGDKKDENRCERLEILLNDTKDAKEKIIIHRVFSNHSKDKRDPVYTLEIVNEEGKSTFLSKVMPLKKILREIEDHVPRIEKTGSGFLGISRDKYTSQDAQRAAAAVLEAFPTVGPTMRTMNFNRERAQMIARLPADVRPCFEETFNKEQNDAEAGALFGLEVDKMLAVIRTKGPNITCEWGDRPSPILEAGVLKGMSRCRIRTALHFTEYGKEIFQTINLDTSCKETTCRSTRPNQSGACATTCAQEKLEQLENLQYGLLENGGPARRSCKSKTGRTPVPAHEISTGRSATGRNATGTFK